MIIILQSKLCSACPVKGKANIVIIITITAIMICMTYYSRSECDISVSKLFHFFDGISISFEKFCYKTSSQSSVDAIDS